MTRNQLRSKYSKRIEQFQSAIRHRSRLINYISLLRLVAGVAVIYSLVLGIKHQGFLFYSISVLMAVIFLILVSLHNRYSDRRELLKQLKSLNQTEQSCLDHRYHTLPDGVEHSDLSHPWSHDLDIFGQGSLFQYLNRTSTIKGNEWLAGMLTTEPEDVEAIKSRQGIIDDLKDRIDFRQNFTARGHLIEEKKDDLQGISSWLSATAYIKKNRWLFYLALTVSSIAVAIIIAGFFNSSNFRYLLPLLLFNWIMLSPFFVRTNHYQVSISRKHELLEGYAELLKIISTEPFQHPSLHVKREQAQKGMKEVVKLSKLLNIFDQRLNMLMGLVFNSLFLFDFIMMHLLENWKHKNREKILEWIELTAWTDAMISLSGFAYNHPGFAIPELDEEQVIMELKGLGHPLIPDEKRVVNDLRIDGEKIVIITGANMAGKSTYLRSLGINTVLAYAGCPVCAERFTTRLMGLYSSMRTADSLRDEESYFLAEIKKLQLIVRRMETGKPLLILLDEVLKGTNTTDKKRGSVGLIKRSLQYPVRCFIATHDLSMGELEKEHGGEIVNYCFESYIRELNLEFDYTIRKGIATNMNASFLMKQMGIMD
ncbi:MAG: hypothetical protein KAR19_19235 [Bacteroidales bacterium]|nr:hypothetical protein [Bacteroidales bacterium]